MPRSIGFFHRDASDAGVLMPGGVRRVPPT